MIETEASKKILIFANFGFEAYFGFEKFSILGNFEIFEFKHDFPSYLLSPRFN